MVFTFSALPSGSGGDKDNSEFQCKRIHNRNELSFDLAGIRMDYGGSRFATAIVSYSGDSP